MDMTDAVRALAALAQESRLAVFRLLVKRGPEGYSAGEIGEKGAVRSEEKEYVVADGDVMLFKFNVQPRTECGALRRLRRCDRWRNEPDTQTGRLDPSIPPGKAEARKPKARATESQAQQQHMNQQREQQRKR